METILQFFSSVTSSQSSQSYKILDSFLSYKTIKSKSTSQKDLKTWKLYTSIIYANLNIVASLRYFDTFSIVASELSLLTSTELEYFRASFSLIAHIVFNPSPMSSNWQSIYIKHGQCEVCIMVVAHSPLFISCIPGDDPAFRSIIGPCILWSLIKGP